MRWLSHVLCRLFRHRWEERVKGPSGTLYRCRRCKEWDWDVYETPFAPVEVRVPRETVVRMRRLAG